MGFLNLEIGEVANTLVGQMSLFNCDMDTAWKNYMHDLLKSEFSYEEIKEYIEKKVK